MKNEFMKTNLKENSPLLMHLFNTKLQSGKQILMFIESFEEILKIVLTQFCCPSPGSRDGSIPYKN